LLPSEHSSSLLHQTDLAQTPLPEILVTIHRYRAPGMLECRRGAEVKTIHLDGGQIIFATSNQLRDSLGDKLLREEKITREQYDESVRRLATTGKRQGTILTEMRVLQPRDLFVALRDQIQAIVWSVFAWDSGTVAFTPGRDKQREFVKLQFPVPQAILQGVRHLPDPRALIARLGAKTTLFERTDKVVDDLFTDNPEFADATRLLQRVDGRRSLFELVQTPPLTGADNARVLYALFALQLIAVKQPVKVQLKTKSGKHRAP
jgi:two-component system OmpR family response regulator